MTPLPLPKSQKYYTSTDPLHSALTFCTSLSLITFILGELTSNASIVDRVWTFLPLIYSAHFTFHDRWAGGKSVSNLFGNSILKATTNDPVTLWSKVVPNGVNDRMFLVFVLQVSPSYLGFHVRNIRITLGQGAIRKNKANFTAHVCIG